ncbi:solute carrier family 25 protein [Lophiotrema nucula]|uniref:Solute carrier family 25 protein n=1 Tax=Lophiotrema nucula TaxID=690887 RepID=A0A6A5YP26_9PLEO|nr:solute carrier family 25 protein [Lophiotrema nucula]
MSADFWAGYLSGAAGILIGNPLDLIKTRLQASKLSPGVEPTAPSSQGLKGHFDRAGTLVRGATAPILTYGALNAILFVTYNRTLSLLSPSPSPQLNPSTPYLPLDYAKIFSAGAAAGLATFLVSAPTELIKCRTQISTSASTTSFSIARDIWRAEGLRGLYYGGGITSIRDAVGYGFYFWSYEWAKQAFTSAEDSDRQAAVKIMLCGGFAGVVTWASIFPMDVVKTRVQTQVLHPQGIGEEAALLQSEHHRIAASRRLSTFEIARQAYQTEGGRVFFRGLGICSVRAFIVNAVQWAVYEWMMKLLQQP